MAESNVDPQKNRLDGIEPKPESDITFQILEIDVTAPMRHFPGVTEDGHVEP